MENTYQSGAWTPSEEAEKTARGALEHVAKNPDIVKGFTAAKAKRVAVESINRELQNQPGDAGNPAHRAVCDAAEKMESKPSIQTAREAFAAFVHFANTRELFAEFSADFLQPLRRAAADDLVAACRATVEAARAKLEADHAARHAAIRAAAAAAKIDMASEIKTADFLHEESLRALDDNQFIHGPSEFAERLGLPH